MFVAVFFLQALYLQLEAVRVKGRTQPVEIFEVASLDSDAAIAGQQSRRGSLDVARQWPSSAVLRPQDSSRVLLGNSPTGLGSLASALAPQLLQLQRVSQLQPAAPARPTVVLPPGGSGLMGLDDPLLSITSTAAAPIKLSPSTPMIGELPL